MTNTTHQAPKKDRRRAARPSPAVMFTVTTLPKKDSTTVYVAGRPSRAHATSFLNIPISQTLKERLKAQIAGSMAMGVSALLQWALNELERQGITLEAMPKK